MNQEPLGLLKDYYFQVIIVGLFLYHTLILYLHHKYEYPL